jgi:flagellin
MISINTNTASSAAAYNLASTSVNLQKSLNRLSSGYRINSSMDDAGGLAVSMKFSAAIRRTDAASANVGNALSFLQVQDGVLKNADKILNRMSELVSLATDVTKTSSDLSLYSTEYTQLQSQLTALSNETFNGISVFGTGSTSVLTVYTSEGGSSSSTISVSQATLGSLATTVAVGTTFSASSSAAAAISTISNAISTLASMRATNGAQQSRMSFAADMLSLNKQSLEAANSRIIDVDVAQESAQLARFNILQQAGTAMLAQANQSTQSILRLLV